MDASPETQTEIETNLAYLEAESQSLKIAEFAGEKALIFLRCDIYLDTLLEHGYGTAA